AIDANCILKNCIFRYASYYNSRSAVNMDNASPTIQNCRFINGYNGIKCNNTSLPVISNCDFSGTDPNSGYAVQNLSTSNTVTATNCWWNSATGPKHTSNPTGIGERVSDNVVFTPYLTQVVKPELGDVSINGTINPYDASLILQYLVSNIILTPKQIGVADVSGNKFVTSYDASMILQYNVGLINWFEKSALKSAVIADNASVSFSDIMLNAGKGTFTIPVQLTTGLNVRSLDLKIAFNPEHISLVNIEAGKCSTEFSFAKSENTGNGEIAVSIASAYDLNLQNEPIYLEFALKNAQISESTIDLASGLANETNLASTSPMTINSLKVATGLQSPSIANEPTITVQENAVCIGFSQPESVNNLNVQLTDITGKVVYSTLIKELATGVKNVFIPLSAIGVHPQGVYIIRLHSNEISTDKKVLIK
ncbi:MAG: dockerin type I domain-containing protein, partial [Bacteroidota bacterium]|nr:dockerin type I domain-containing protein [Bacteroidota bacterium]